MSRIGRGPGALRRWGTVVAATGVLATAPAVADRIPARATRIDPAILLDRIAGSAGVAYSGYAESAAHLGLPDVREVEGVIELLGGTTRLRVWWRDPAAWRVDLLTATGERATYADGLATWLWDSGSQRATRVVGQPRVRLPRPADLIPPEFGRRLAALAAPGDRVTARDAVRVAGQAYPGIRIEPASAGTTVGRVDIWADPVSGLPVRVDLTARGESRPAIRTAFLELTRGAPAADRVTFAPRGVSVDIATVADLATALDEQVPVHLPGMLGELPRRDAVAKAVGTYGSGYGIVAVVAMPDRLVRRVGRRLAAAGLLTFVSTPLLNGLVVADDIRGGGFVVSGAVPRAVLDRVAADLVGP